MPSIIRHGGSALLAQGHGGVFALRSYLLGDLLYYGGSAEILREESDCGAEYILGRVPCLGMENPYPRPKRTPDRRIGCGEHRDGGQSQCRGKMCDSAVVPGIASR